MQLLTNKRNRFRTRDLLCADVLELLHFGQLFTFTPRRRVAGGDEALADVMRGDAVVGLQGGARDELHHTSTTLAPTIGAAAAAVGIDVQ